MKHSMPKLHVECLRASGITPTRQELIDAGLAKVSPDGSLSFITTGRKMTDENRFQKSTIADEVYQAGARGKVKKLLKDGEVPTQKEWIDAGLATPRDDGSCDFTAAGDALIAKLNIADKDEVALQRSFIHRLALARAAVYQLEEAGRRDGYPIGNPIKKTSNIDNHSFDAEGNLKVSAKDWSSFEGNEACRAQPKEPRPCTVAVEGLNPKHERALARVPL